MASISGEVRDVHEDLLADCVVRAYRRDTGALLVAGLSGDDSPEVPGDTDYASVALLLAMNGANSGTVFTDTSPSPKTVTRYNAVTKTDQYKWGGSSGYFDGNGDYLTIANNPLSGAGDFCIECWLRVVSLPASDVIMFFSVSGFNIEVNTAGNVGVYYAPSYVASSNAITAANWHHVAITRSSGVLRIFIDGVKGAEVSGVTYSLGSTSLYIGRDANSAIRYLYGHVNDYRLTTVARYTANFTPPTAAFQDNAYVPAKPLGQYSLTTAYTDEVQVIALDPAGGTTFNDRIIRVIPA